MKSTLDMVGQLLAEDKSTAEKQRKAADKGHGYISPSTEVGECLNFRKADAGGMIASWYGPNGSRDIIIKDAKEGAEVLKKFFGSESDSEA